MGLPVAMQVIQAILKDEADDTQVALLYANQTPDDILLHAELEQLARDPRLRVWYTGGRSACCTLSTSFSHRLRVFSAP